MLRNFELKQSQHRFVSLCNMTVFNLQQIYLCRSFIVSFFQLWLHLFNALWPIFSQGSLSYQMFSSAIMNKRCDDSITVDQDDLQCFVSYPYYMWIVHELVTSWHRWFPHNKGCKKNFIWSLKRLNCSFDSCVLLFKYGRFYFHYGIIAMF